MVNDIVNRYLHNAVRRNDADLVASFLAKNGMDVNGRDGYGMTALMWAAGRGYLSIALLLLQHGAGVEAKNELLSVRSIEKLETGKGDYWELIDRMGMLEANKHHGWTALVWAARNGRTDLVNLLLDRGADINIITKDGFTALVHSLENKHRDTAHLLLRRGANPNLEEDNCSPALPIAAKYGLVDLVREVLNLGGSISALDNFGHTALSNAVVGNHAETLTLLLKSGVDVNTVYPEDSEVPPLHIAAVHDALECARILLSHGARINAKDELNGATALQFALDEIGGPNVARLLIERGADTQGALETVEHFQDQPEAAELIKLLKSHPKDGAGS